MSMKNCLSAAAVCLVAGWCAVFVVILSAEACAADGRTPKEQTLLAVLRGDAAEADKAMACKELAVFGSVDAVPDLAKLLDNERLASWARIPLEAIPDAECDAALREAAGRLSGRLLVGVINSLGVRRDAAAVELLAKRLGDGDPNVADAAAAALGNVGNAAAAEPLRKALASASPALRASAAEGCVLCAERLLAVNQAAAATALYDAVRRADVPRQRLIEATRGAILARGEQGVPLLLETLRSPDRDENRIALGAARELKTEGVVAALVAELPRSTAERAVLLIEALADLGGSVAVPAMLQATVTGPKPVRLAAMRALGRSGDASCVDPLLAAAADGDVELAASAKTALAELSGGGTKGIDDQIRGRLVQARGQRLPLLIEIVGLRRISAVDEVAAALGNPDPAVRGTALACLGEIVDLERLQLLVRQAVAPKDPADAEVAMKALRAASVRMADREACADKLVSAMASAPPQTKVAILEILGEVAGSRSLAALVAAAKSDDAALQDASTRLLGNWMTAEAGPPLLELANGLTVGKFQSRAFRGYLRILRQFTTDDADRSRMGRLAYAAARTADDRKAVLDAVRRTPTMDMLTLVVEAGETPELREDARIATATIMSKMGEATPEAWTLAGRLGLPKVQLEILRATYGAGDVQKDVTTPLRKVVGNVPLIPLPAAGYNASFGGDPAPGQTKRLLIQYRLNGAPGEATFAEDAVIVLPVPGAAAGDTTSLPAPGGSKPLHGRRPTTRRTTVAGR
jgi:HEAT repeat protein